MTPGPLRAPLEAVGVPPTTARATQYSHHGFVGTGTVYPLRVDDTDIGTLSVSEDWGAVAWQREPDLPGDPAVLAGARFVADALAGGADADLPLRETVESILRRVSSRLPIHRADLSALEHRYERSRRRGHGAQHDCEC